CNIHSADRVVPEWQDIRPGDEVRLHPDVALEVAAVDPGRWLVLRSAVPDGPSPPFGFTWVFALQAGPDGTTRLIARERYAYTRPGARFIVEPVDLIDFVMTQKMLRGIRSRAERDACPQRAAPPVQPRRPRARWPGAERRPAALSG